MLLLHYSADGILGGMLPGSAADIACLRPYLSPGQLPEADFKALGCANVPVPAAAYDDAIFNPHLPAAAMNDGKVLFVGGADGDGGLR